jgi:hypothetical protein
MFPGMPGSFKRGFWDFNPLFFAIAILATRPQSCGNPELGKDIGL